MAHKLRQQLKPPEDFRPFEVYRRLLRYVLPHWRVFALGIIGMIGSASVDVGLVGMMKPLLDGTFVKRDPDVIRWIPLAVVGLFLLRGVSNFMALYGMNWISRQVATDLRRDMFLQMQKLPMRFFDNTTSSRLVARLTHGTEQVANVASTTLTSAAKNALTMIGLIGMMFWMSWRLSLFIFLVAPPMALVVRYVQKRARRIGHRVHESVNIVSDAVNEAAMSQRVIKIHNAQDFEIRAFEKASETKRQLQMKMVATSAGSGAVIQFIAAWAVASIIYFATKPEVLAQVTAGTFASFMGALMGLMNPMKGLNQMGSRFQQALIAAADIFKLIDEAPEPAGGSRALERARGRIEFQNVSFAYAGRDAQVLRDISFAVEPGQTVAFVGKTGSGKSTLLSLLPRFYDPGEGTILLDGHDLRDYVLRDLRAQFTLVDQTVRLFNASIADNIAYGLEPAPPEARIIEACKMAHAWEFIEKLPQGLRTLVGQNGVLLSGGQRQRLTIARALLKDAPVLLLDEATSSLDTESERYIQESLTRLASGRTTLVIAHRLSTVQGADRIVVLQDGRIVETGNHAELLAHGGVYAALYQMQFQA